MIAKIRLVGRRLASDRWAATEWAVICALLGLSFYMFVRAELLYDAGRRLGVDQGTLDMAGSAVGTTVIIVGVPSLIIYIIGRISGKYQE